MKTFRLALKKPGCKYGPMIARNSLRQAAKKGDTRALKAMLREGIDVNAPFVHDWTLIHFAAKSGHADTVSFLLSLGADPNALNDLWQTPLDIATADVVVAALTKAGSKKGIETSLHAASFSGDVKWVRKHLRSGADVNELRRGTLPLCLALRRKKPDIIRCLLREHPMIKKQEAEGETTMHVAASSGADESTLNALLQMGADVNARDKWGRTPLCSAAAAGDLRLVNYLIQHGAIVKGRFPKGSDPLSEAIDQCNYEIGCRLIEEGAQVSVSQAVQCGHVDATKSLIQQGADLEQVEAEWASPPLLSAVYSENFEIAQMLLEAGANPNVQTSVYYSRQGVSGGDTPLHWAVSDGAAKLVKLLLSHGADPDVQNAEGVSALEAAKRREKTNLVRIMEAHLERQIAETEVEQLYPVPKIAGLLSVDDAFVMKLIETGKLRQIKLDAQTVRISESSFKSFLANLQKQNTPECHGPVP